MFSFACMMSTVPMKHSRRVNAQSHISAMGPGGPRVPASPQGACELQAGRKLSHPWLFAYCVKIIQGLSLGFAIVMHSLIINLI